VPYATVADRQLYYETSGRGTVDGTATVVFVGDAGLGPWQWAWQADALAGPFETVVPTTRGCGQADASSDASDDSTGGATPSTGSSHSGDLPNELEPDALLADLDAVVSDAGVDEAHVVAAGLGGLLAVVAARRRSWPERLVLLGTPPTGTRSSPEWVTGPSGDEDELRAATTAALSDEFCERQPDAVDQIVAWRAAEDASPAERSRQVAALSGLDATDWLYEVTNEALVIHGDADAVCPPDAGEQLARELPRGEFSPVADAGHLVGVEASRLVNDRLHAFLGGADGY
jgi:pimeloyl-ACP methyl ester carboxylesterase